MRKKKVEEKEYLVRVPVVARGTQVFTVKASSSEEAISKVGDAGGDFEYEELSVTNFKIDQAEAEENV